MAEMDIAERVRGIVEPLLTDLGLEIYDIEHGGGLLKVVVDREGGVDMEALGEITRRVSRALDEYDPISGHYTLEVSSPGLERTLRTPAHFAGAVGEKVSIKTVPTYDGERRLTGVIATADDDGVVIRSEAAPTDDLRLGYDDIERARTVFEWGPAPKPGKQKKRATT
jgi:ribosome maturation factor RimP